MLPDGLAAVVGHAALNPHMEGVPVQLEMETAFLH